ncbi:MAG: carboxypeptidase-like regulatory domain-containing protein [Syntrophothermus sp.]
MPKSLKYLVFFILSVFLLIFPACQEDTVDPISSGSIRGTVISADSSKPVAGVNISTTPASAAVITDAAGKFQINNVPAASYSIMAKKNGYKQIVINVAVSSNEATEASIIIVKEITNTKMPLVPASPAPGDKSLDQPLSLQLKWNKSETDPNLPVKYDISIYESNTALPVKSVKNYTDTVLSLENLKFRTTYYWQVVVRDSFNTVKGDVWSFTTRQLPVNPIVFASNKDGNYEIYSTDSSSANTIRLTFNSATDWYPRFSPDRTKIAFISNRDNQQQIFLMNPDGSEVLKLTSMTVAGYNNNGIGLCWSPDSKQLLFSHYDILYRINRDGTNLTQLARAPAGRHFRECDWAMPNNKILALTQGANPWDNEIYIMNTDGSNMQMAISNMPGIIESPSFSLDGRTVMFTHDISGLEIPEGRQLNSHIFLLNLTTMDTTDVSGRKPDGINDLRARFSADGGRIIFEYKWADNFSKSSLWTTDLQGLNRQMIFSEGAMPDWK